MASRCGAAAGGRLKAGGAFDLAIRHGAQGLGDEVELKIWAGALTVHGASSNRNASAYCASCGDSQPCVRVFPVSTVGGFLTDDGGCDGEMQSQEFRARQNFDFA